MKILKNSKWLFILTNLFLFAKIAKNFSRCEPEEPCSLCMFHPRDCLGKIKIRMRK